MTNRPSQCCDVELLRRSLNEELSEAEEDVLALHLSACGKCQTVLEELAGQPQAWIRVGTTLKAVCSTGTDVPQVAHLVVDQQVDDAADFAVECLEPSTAADSIGRLDDIEIHSVIGSGGMGVVLKGHQPELNRLVAVKVLAPQLAVSSAARQRFAREARATAAILHPNVMSILSVHSGSRLPYLVMPYVACESLQQRIDREGTLDLIDILRIGMQTANGLAAAHAQGLVHRDVKPANILLEGGVENVMLTDFGLARAIDDSSLTRTGVIAGTPLYMSPEQSRGEPVDTRSDLFSLGSVLYTLATGRTPFRAESTYGILRRLTDETPRSVRELSPQLPAWLEMIVHRLLAKKPSDRFDNASQVAELLEGCIAHAQQPITAPLPPECAACDRRRPALFWTSLTAATLVAVTGLWGLFGPAEPDEQPVKIKPTPVSSSLNVSAKGSSDAANPKSEDNWDAAEDDVRKLRHQLEQWNKDAGEFWTDSSP